MDRKEEVTHYSTEKNRAITDSDSLRCTKAKHGDSNWYGQVTASNTTDV